MMTIEELILNALNKCLETADEEQRRLFLWMKAALQYPGLEQFIQEIQQVEHRQGTISVESLHKAVEFAESFNEYQIRSLSVSQEDKDNLVRLEKIRLKEVELRIVEILCFLGYLQPQRLGNHRQKDI